ncbi:MAG: hypothetical protein ACRD21_18445, partial [Vicinamibacteria bacterium]
PSPASTVAPAAPAAASPAPLSAVGRALVAFPAPDPTAAMAGALSRLGFIVDQLEAGDDKLLRLQQGDYAIVASTRNGVPEERNAYRIVQMLAPEIRRRVFLVLVGDELQTGEGIQAFALAADLVVHPKDAPQCDRLLAQSLHERRRLYQTYWDAEDRKMEGKL